MSTIIKAGTEPATAGSSIQRVAFNFDDMSSQADRYLDQVRGEAAKIVEEARAEAAAIRSQAEHQGHQAALQAVEGVVSKHMQTLMPALKQTITDIQNSKQQWLAHWQSSAISVASAIAAKVIRRELSQQPEITLDLINEALELAAGSAEIKLHLNPEDLKNLGGQVKTLAEEIHQLSPTDIVANSEISRGGCRVETRFGSIDQQLEAQLKRISEELT